MPTSSAEAPRLIAVHPAGPAWPANILRFHLVFDREMEPAGAAEAVAIETAAGHPMAGVLVDLPDGLWSPDGRILTLLLHPGRVKHGLAAHERLGRALLSGRAYRLVIGPGLADIGGRPLGRRTCMALRAGPEVETPIDITQWRWTAPAPGSRDRLVIHTGRALDALSVRGALHLLAPDGTSHPARLDVADDRLVVHPQTPWPATVRLSAGPALEDVCGNRPGHAFEHQVAADRS